MIPQFQQNKISGLSIAWARATWDHDLGCYTFPTSDSYAIRVTDQWMMERGLTEDDLLDCVAQVENQLGSPDEYRPALGLFPNSGYSNIGSVVRSRSYPAVHCVFTPTSTEDHYPDAYFEWYFDNSNPSVVDLNGFIKGFSDMTGSRTANVVMSPVMPSYMEAQEFFLRNPKMFSCEESFLSLLWKYHQTPSKGFKNSLREQLLPQWTELKEEETWLDRKVTNPKTGQRVKIRSLPADIRAKYKPKGKDAPKKKEPEAKNKKPASNWNNKNSSWNSKKS